MAVTYNILPFIPAIKIEEYNTVLNSDHSPFIFDFDAWLYFGIKLSKPKKPQHLNLNSGRCTHRTLFSNKAEDILRILNLEEIAERLEKEYVPEELEYLDAEITWIMQQSTKSAEGPIRNIPFSDKKLQLFVEKEYWRKKLVLCNGSSVNIEEMENDL